MFGSKLCIILTFMVHIIGKDADVAETTKVTSTLVWVNHTLELKCKVPEEDFERIVWKKGDEELLAVGSVMFTTNIRVSVEKPGSLRVEKIQKSDSGYYLCQPGGRNDPAQKHTFEVKVQEFRCPQLTPSKHVAIKYSHPRGQAPFTDGTIAVYSCEKGYMLTTPANRNCTEKAAQEDPWNGQDPTCIAEELMQIEQRLGEMEKQLQERDITVKPFREKYSKSSNDRILRMEIDMVNLQRKQEEFRTFTLNALQTLNLTTTTPIPTTATDENLNAPPGIQHQLNEMWMRVTLFHNELQTRMERLEKNMEEVFNFPENPFKEPNQKASSRLTELSSLVSLRLGMLENETKVIEDTLYKQMKLLEHVDKMNAIASAWEENQKVPMAKMRLTDNGRIIWEFIWIVHNIDSKLKRSLELGSHFSTQSNPFYTGVPGYRLRLVLYPNFDDSGQMGLFAGLLPGIFDDQVKWPFNWDFHLGVISHDPENARDHVGIISMPPITCDISNFQRPIPGAPPSACGFRHFISHKTLTDQVKAYTTNGHLWIRMRVFTR